MGENFIAKLETKNYLIGSFDAYQEISKILIKDNSNLSDEEANSILNSMPVSYRATVIDKLNNNYIGYIGLYKVDEKNGIASIRFEIKKNISDVEKKEIIDEYKKYLSESLNIVEIEEITFISNNITNIEKNQVVPNSSIIIPSKLLELGISDETLELFSKDYSIPKLQMPCTIKSSDRIIGIIGLSNLIWSNKRANLNIFLDKSLGSDVIGELSPFIIDDYINYVHNSNVHNVTISVSGSNREFLQLLNSTSMAYYGTIPYAYNNGENVESSMMFQHIPNMSKKNETIIPNNNFFAISKLQTEKKEMNEYIDLNNGYKLVSPKAFEKLGISASKVLSGHIEAIQDRQGFAIPLGEDKYFLQKDNGNYGLSKAMMNYSYIILDDKNNYSGYINILRTNAGGKNAELEIGISSNLRNRGLGTIVINRFYEELFSIGYASVTSAIFSFNSPSLRLHEKVAELNGIRLESYYINGKLWDMHFYSKVNNLITEETHERHI